MPNTHRDPILALKAFLSQPEVAQQGLAGSSLGLEPDLQEIRVRLHRAREMEIHVSLSETVNLLMTGLEGRSSSP